PRMFFPQLGIDIVVSADGMITDVSGVRAVNPVRPPALVNTLVQRIGSRMRMIGTVATMRDQISVMLEHVEVVVSDYAFDFVLRPFLCWWKTDINRLALERFRLPVFRDIGHHPVAYLCVPGIERSRFGGESCLSPIHPEAEFKSVLVRVIGNSREAARKFLRIG